MLGDNDEWELLSNLSDRSEATFISLGSSVLPIDDAPFCSTDSVASSPVGQRTRRSTYGVRTKKAQDGVRYFEATLPAKDSSHGLAVRLGQYATAAEAAAVVQQAIADPTGAASAAAHGEAVQQVVDEQDKGFYWAPTQPAVRCVDGQWRVDYVGRAAEPLILEPSFCEPDPRPASLRSVREKEKHKAKALEKKEKQRLDGHDERAARLIGAIDAAWLTVHPEAGTTEAGFRAGRKAVLEKMTATSVRGPRSKKMPVLSKGSPPGEMLLCEAVLNALWQTHRRGSVPPKHDSHGGGAVHSTTGFLKLWGTKAHLVCSLEGEFGLTSAAAEELADACFATE